VTVGSSYLLAVDAWEQIGRLDDNLLES
jgi:hypothetical protein